MSDLISRKALLKAMDKEKTEMEEAMCIPSWATAKHCIKDMPTVDAVEVVRCKDCKYKDWDNKEADAIVCLRLYDGHWRTSNDYCSYGKKMDGEET